MGLTIKNKVRNILSAVPQTRNSDKELFIMYMQKAGMNLTEHQIQVLRDMPSMETIRRTRQIIQNTEGSLRPDQSITDARFRKFKQMRQNIPFMEAEKMDDNFGIPWSQRGGH